MCPRCRKRCHAGPSSLSPSIDGVDGAGGVIPCGAAEMIVWGGFRTESRVASEVKVLTDDGVYA